MRQCTIKLIAWLYLNVNTVHCIHSDIQVTPSSRQTVAVEPGELRSLTFTCSYIAQTTLETFVQESVTLVWSHNGVSLSSSEGKYSVSTSYKQTMNSFSNVLINTTSTLAVHALQLWDSGDYECGVDVSVVSAEKEAQMDDHTSTGVKLIVISKSVKSCRYYVCKCKL